MTALHPLPQLTAAAVPATIETTVIEATGERRTIRIPDERALALYVDRRELVTLMTLGRHPEWLVLGYLLNQGLIGDVREVESVTVDWDVGAAAVRTHGGVEAWEARTARRTVTTGCGQGTVFGDLWAGVRDAPLPEPAEPLATAELAAIAEAMRQHPGVYRDAGSVHGTALWRRPPSSSPGAPFQLAFFVEDVGRHNAVDTLAGWMAMHGLARGDGGRSMLFTTGRLTSEMVMKAARLGIPVVVSRNGVTAMGLALAREVGLTLIGRASGRRFLCYAGAERLRFEPVADARVA